MSTLLAILYFSLYVVRRDIGFSITEEITLDVLPVLLNSVAILHFVNSVLLLRNKYKYLNFELESSALNPCKVTHLNNGDTSFMTPVENYTFAMKLSISEPRNKSASSRHQRFRNLRIIYSQLHDVTLLINSAYGIPLLCATFWVFINIISAANYAINLKQSGYLYVMETVLWSSFCVALMTIMAVSCSLAVNECNRSPVIVQKILLRDDIDSEDAKDLDKMFTQFQVMKIGFSACGMFRIDLSFLCGIFGVTLSYLIIILQQ
jgi:cytochrome bd-type quinol oxidase subunit 1